jgi:hypothetical protein
MVISKGRGAVLGFEKHRMPKSSEVHTSSNKFEKCQKVLQVRDKYNFHLLYFFKI